MHENNKKWIFFKKFLTNSQKMEEIINDIFIYHFITLFFPDNLFL